MEANELRIGNYVIVDNDMRIEHLGIHSITELRTLDCQVRLNDMDVYGQYYKFIKPIPLTEEWLLKFGFVIKFKKTQYFEFEEWIKLELEDNNKHNPSWDFRCKNTYLTCIKHVHQLQNLYFALTGEELTIK